VKCGSMESGPPRTPIVSVWAEAARDNAREPASVVADKTECRDEWANKRMKASRCCQPNAIAAQARNSIEDPRSMAVNSLWN
jgi:hypothetical protein